MLDLQRLRRQLIAAIEARAKIPKLGGAPTSERLALTGVLKRARRGPRGGLITAREQRRKRTHEQRAALGRKIRQLEAEIIALILTTEL